MNNNNTTNIQESKICCQCMTFYANPKFGSFCSKCYKDKKPEMEQNSTKIEPPVNLQNLKPPKTNKNEICCNKEDQNDLKKEPKIEEKIRPIQVQ